MKLYTSAVGRFIQEHGTPMKKMPSTVYMLCQPEAFEVETNEGRLSGKADDFVAYDPKSGHVWPVSKEYVAMHYERVSE
jgi:hypothetical protein